MKTLFCFLLCLALTSSKLYAQGFNSITTSDGVNVTAVGDQGRIYRSVNSGSTWKIYNLNSVNLKSVCSYQNDVWISGDNGKVYKTSKTNSPVMSISLDQNFSVNSIYFVNSNLGFLCGEHGYVYKSIDGGLSWVLSNTGISKVKLNSISFSNSLTGIAAGENGAVYTTSNGGSSWNTETVPTSRNLLKTKFFPTGVCVVGEWGTILTKYNGESWILANTRTTSDIRGVSGTSFSDIHVCGGGGFIRNNKGKSFNFFNFEVNPMLANLSDIFYYNATTAFAVSSLNKAVIKTTNAGVLWTFASSVNVSYSWIQKTPAGSGIGNNLCMHPSDRNSAFVVYGTQVYATRDKGDTWNQIATIGIGSRAHSFYVSPIDTNIWMAAMNNSTDCVVRSTNYGATWTNIIAQDFSTYGQPLEMDQNNPSVFYFAPANDNGNGLYKSTNNGANFSLIAPYNNAAINQPCDIIVMWDSANVIYLGDDGADIWKSVNSGLNWSLVNQGSSSEVPSMCNSVFDRSICYATTWSSSIVFKTSNFGSNWNTVSTNSGSGWGSDLCREDPTVVLTGNYGAKSFLTTNSGTSFFEVNTGLGGAGAGIMVPERGYFLNMQASNLYKMNIVYNVADSSGTIPSSNSLKVNLKVLMEGMYSPALQKLSRKDPVKFYLRNSSSPYQKIDSASAVIDSVSLSALYVFANAGTGNYYFDVTHFNTIETWSRPGGEALASDNSVYNFNFTDSDTKAFGNNLKLKTDKYCMYSGDVNQDGFIDLSDLQLIDNDVYNITIGSYHPSDLNGDNIVDLSDMQIGENNNNFISVISP